MQRFPVLVIALLISSFPIWAQSPTATLDGRVLDPSRAVIEGVRVDATNLDTNLKYSAQTNSAGLFTIVNLPPGSYRIEVSKPGFRTIINPMVVLHVQDVVALNFNLPVGSVSESVTVSGGVPLVNTEDAAVSTVVDRNFAENLPMNGRSFQTLIQLTPGVVLTTSNSQDNGQFSVNGQRAASNYWMVDGVSANIGLGVNSQGVTGNGLAGALGAFSVVGGTNSLVSLDAVQEFRIQTSSYAPEFGRTPGGQISILTRSGTDKFHGTAFNYFRNDILDANEWFNGYTNSPPIPKVKERQNDFGGTFSGPFFKHRTFFFFSYEGLRLRLPQTTLTTVPDFTSRLSAVQGMQPYLNAYPVPNGPEIFAPDQNGVLQPTGAAGFTAAYSNPATLDAYSLRVDHKLSDKLSLFARYNYSPSKTISRGANLYTLNTLDSTRLLTTTGTAGVSWVISPNVANDLRFNYSPTSASSRFYEDSFGGAVPLMTSELDFPNSFTPQNSHLLFVVARLQQGWLQVGQFQKNRQRQINIVDGLSLQKGSHSLKFGVDFRRLSPLSSPAVYQISPNFRTVDQAVSGTPRFIFLQTSPTVEFLFRNLGVYAQDTWRVAPRFAATFGVRWDVDFVPRSLNGLDFPALTGFDLRDLSKLSLAPTGTPPYGTKVGNFAPRIGIAYQITQSSEWQTVLRGGLGVFYDLASSEAGNLLAIGAYPFGASAFLSGTFPVEPAPAPVPLAPPTASNPGILTGFDPHLQLPYTLEWNVAFEQSLGAQQVVSASYVGAAGRRLLNSPFDSIPLNSSISALQVVVNAGTSDYNALQLQFQRRLSRGLQILTSYVWAHSIDTASAGSFANASNLFVPSALASANRGPSDFDVRNAFSAGVTYDIPGPTITNAFARAVFRDWSVQSIVQARSAPPVDVSDINFFNINGFFADVRPDVIPGIPLYLYGSQYPGGKSINNTPNQGGPGCLGPFCDPPIDPATGNPLRNGNLGRNSLRAFSATQWDFAVHRDFPIHESLKLQFRAEMFNLLNHPNFGPPSGQFGAGGFGLSSQTLARSLDSGNQGGGSFSPLYQIGGPRSVEFALKIQF